MSQKVVITGGAGFIGSQLGYRLYTRGYEVVLIDDLSFGHKENLSVDGKSFGTFKERDIRDTTLRDDFIGADCVFHLAAISALPVCQSEPYRAVNVNVAGTANVLEAARQAGVRRVIFASTNAIYENNTKTPFCEDDDVAPTLIYPVTKLCSEHLCQSFLDAYNMEIVIIRYHNVYGPHQDIYRKSPPLIGYIIRELLAGQVPILHAHGDQERDYVYIDDVVALNELCMHHPKASGEVFNAASGIAYSVKDLYTIIAKILESNIQPEFRTAGKFWDAYPSLRKGQFPLSAEKLEKEVNKFTLGDTRKVKTYLDWEASVDIEQGLEATIAATRRTLGYAG